MGVHFVQQQRSVQKQSLKDVSELKALRHIRRARGTHSPEQLAAMDADIQRGDFLILGGYFTDIRHRNLEGFRGIGELLRDRDASAGKLTRKLTIELAKELRCWAENNAGLQELRSYFHPAHLLQPDMNPDYRALQLGYLYLAVLGQRTYHQEQGLLDHRGKPSTLLLERIHRATRESALTPYLDTTRGPLAYPLLSLPKEQWQRGAIQSLYLDYLTDSMVLAASQRGLELNGEVLAPHAATATKDYISKTLGQLGERLDRYLAEEAQR